MIYWGIGDINIRQNRFDYIDRSFAKSKNIFLIEPLIPNKILNEFFNGSDVIYAEAEKNRDFIQII